MQHVQGFRILILICPLLILMMSCEYEGPDAVWDPNYNQGATPVIESVSPEGAATAGFANILINGENFSSDLTLNSVYFNNVQVEVKKATTNQLTVYRPNLVAENLTITVVVHDAVLYATFSPYAVNAIGGVYAQTKNIGKANTIAVDTDGNLMIHMDKKELHKVLSTGDLELIMETKPRIVFDMKVGPGGYIYFTRDQNYINRVPLTGGEFEMYANGTPGKIKYFDWDSQLNIYAGGENSGLIRIKSDATFSNTGLYTDYDIRAIRVYENAVYLAAIYTGSDDSVPVAGIWKNVITSNEGDVGPSVLVLDWTQSGSFAATEFTDITFDVNGVMYVATNGGADGTLDPILIISPDGSVDAFYKGGLLKGPIMDMAWGNDAMLYFLRSTDDNNVYEIYRLIMAAAGAPEYGLQ
jgi:hypothetical protein